MNSGFMTVNEVASILRLSEPIIRRLARRGRLSAIKVGGSWRFSKRSFYEFTEE